MTFLLKVYGNNKNIPLEWLMAYSGITSRVILILITSFFSSVKDYLKLLAIQCNRGILVSYRAFSVFPTAPIVWCLLDLILSLTVDYIDLGYFFILCC